MVWMDPFEWNNVMPRNVTGHEKCRGQKLCSLFDFRVTQKLIDREK